MKPQDQTIHGKGTGNCFPACLASILETEIEQVPHFCARFHYWQEACNEWLAAYFGLSLITISWPPAASTRITALPRGGLVILSGKSPRFDCNHSVVGQIGRANGEPRMVHDPHPERAGLKRITEIDYFVTLEPRIGKIDPPDAAAWKPPEEFALPKAQPVVDPTP